MREACSMCGRDEKYVQKFYWKTSMEEALGRHRHTREDNIRMALTEIGVGS
jgi:hypothetical protein